MPEFDEDDYQQRLGRARNFVEEMENHNQVISRRSKALGHFYTLWCLIVLNEELPTPAVLAEAYEGFMEKVEMLSNQEDIGSFLREADTKIYRLPFSYLDNFRGANTDLTPREQRYQALRTAVLTQNV